VMSRSIMLWAAQGGIHPDFDGDTYVRIVEAAKRGAPDVHVHAFSPLEVQHGSQAAGVPVPQYLRRLRDAGLSSLPGARTPRCAPVCPLSPTAALCSFLCLPGPTTVQVAPARVCRGFGGESNLTQANAAGTAAEVLDDAVRAVLCPDKLSAGEWLEVVSEAHGVGLPTTATLMFGHVDTPVAWAKHLLQLRKLQAATGGCGCCCPPFDRLAFPLSAGRARPPPVHPFVSRHSGEGVCEITLLGASPVDSP